MSKTDDELEEILIRLVSQFAGRDEEGNWWGFDTNVGTQSIAFAAAKRSIRAFKVRHMPASKRLETYKSLGNINRDAIAKAVWGRNVPGWWKGSTAEFSFLKEVARAKS